MDQDIGFEDHIYIIDCGSFEKSTNEFTNEGVLKRSTAVFVENIDLTKIEKMVENYKNIIGKDLIVHLVDKNFKIRYYYTYEGQKYFNMIHDLQKRTDIKIIFHDCEWYELDKSDIINNTSIVHYIATTQSFINIYDFTNWLGFRIYDHIFLKYGFTDFDDLIDSKKINMVIPYNIYGNQEDYITIENLPPHIDIEAVEWIIENGVKTVQAHIKAGFYDKERYVQNRIPCWTLNTESHFIKGIIEEYEIFPPIIVSAIIGDITSKTIQEKFQESADYRFVILEKMCEILSKIGIKFGKIKEAKIPHLLNFDLLLKN